VVVSDPDADGLSTMTWRSETELWSKLGYFNPTRTYVTAVLNGVDPTSIANYQSGPDVACRRMANGGSSDYVHGEWA
jgi:hypothetical protein